MSLGMNLQEGAVLFWTALIMGVLEGRTGGKAW
jgi:hypothetical protein